MPEESASDMEDQGKKGGGPQTAEVVTAKEVKPISWLNVTAVSLLISVLMSAGSVFVYDRYFAQKIIAVDVKGYIVRQRDLYLQGKLTDEQFRANIDKLEAAVKNIPKNRVAIMGDAVIKNAEQQKLPN